jgi:acetoin utilization deacetylase AcuC-like enzyme
MRVYTSSIFYRHHTGPGHPESPDRLDSALAGVGRAGLADRIVRDPAAHPETDRIIAKVHSEAYAQALENACRNGYHLFHSADNPISAETASAARAAVSTSLAAAEDVWGRQSEERAFVIARPPGHHAIRDEAMGFCFFNTVACVAELLREKEGIERVFILDWDVHHGNGTQDIFEQREDVYYASMHRYPFYPGTGASYEIGVGRGRGFTRNVPFDEGTGDARYLHALEREILPAIEQYAPQAILISAGFDAHGRDPLGGMHVTEKAFGEMTRRIVESAEKHTGGRVLSLLEGGYDAEGLAASVAEHVHALENG